MKTVHTAAHKNGIITKIVKINEHRPDEKVFKMIYECTNGCSNLSTLVMNSEGEFKYVFSKFDLGDTFTFVASYVSDLSAKKQDAEKGFKLMETLISKVYTIVK